jgi:hypothetical protein
MIASAAVGLGPATSTLKYHVQGEPPGSPGESQCQPVMARLVSFPCQPYQISNFAPCMTRLPYPRGSQRQAINKYYDTPEDN